MVIVYEKLWEKNSLSSFTNFLASDGQVTDFQNIKRWTQLLYI